MSWISDIFKKKPGGSGVGNFIRGALNTVSGGLLGTGKNVLPANTSGSTTYTPQPNIGSLFQPVVKSVLESSQNDINNSANNTMKATLKKYWWVIALPFGTLIAIIIYISKSRNNGKKIYRKY